MPEQLGVRGRHADLERQALAEGADALDVQARLGVVPLDAMPRRWKISTWVSHSSCVRSRTRRSSSALSRVTACRARLSAS